MTGNGECSVGDTTFELFGRMVTVSSSTDQGRRDENQDCLGWFAITPNGNFGSVDEGLKGQEMLFCAICDGMGGMADGAAASRTVINALLHWAPTYTGDIDGFYPAIKEVLNEAEGFLVKVHPGCGTTLVVLICIEDNWYSIHIGDSRCYVVSDNGIERTYDHAPVDDLFRRGLINEDEALTHPLNSTISAFIGSDNSRLSRLEMNSRSVPQMAILCSDGAYGCMKEDDFLSICRENDAHSIALKCYVAGSSDNISVIKVSVS